MFARKFDEKIDMDVVSRIVSHVKEKKIVKIGIVTIYESITNMGSFLQAYAMKGVLEEMGHEVYFIQNVPPSIPLKQCLCKINPKREIFLRWSKAKFFITDMRYLKVLPKDTVLEKKLDLLIYGSDEIWNLDNPYFQEDLFWGLGLDKVKKLAYAVSIGAMSEETEERQKNYFSALPKFQQILVRDTATKDFIERRVGYSPEYVCDPTILYPVEKINKQSKKVPKEKYLLVYTYGVDKWLEEKIVTFARKNNLLIVSPCFWHTWADKIIQCSALELGFLMKDAEYVVSTTFHGAIFALLNHTRCCIFPGREKVADVVNRLGEGHRLIERSCTYKDFCDVLYQPFDNYEFEKRVEEFREVSIRLLKESLK